MQPAANRLPLIKERMRATWSAGDFGQIARFTAKAAEDFVERVGIKPGMRVLDVACGTGNVAIPAARKGAVVSGVDIAPNLLAQARQRAADEHLNASFDEGDAEQLPYGDDHFDVVITMFGAMFGPRPETVASELARVCRPGGMIAMANWVPQGLIAEQFALGNRYVPPPEGVQPPVLWGDDKTVRERLRSYSSDIQTSRQTVEFDYPFPPRETVEFFKKYFGPTQMALSTLAADRQSAYSTELEDLWRKYNAGGEDRTQVRAEYLQVIAVCR